jgi:hypothetical protein
MLLIDDILLSPYKGLLWVFEEIHNTAVDELEGEAERIRNELTDLYMMLETEQIDDAEFDRRESALLDRLDELEAQGLADEDDAEDADAEEAADDAGSRRWLLADADADADAGTQAHADADADARRVLESERH